MLKSYKTTLYFVLAVAVAIFLYFFYFEAKPVVNEQAGVALASYTNAKGEKWTIPTGKDDFLVSSGEDYPKFVLGSIDPVKVSIGDTQRMQIVVRNNFPFKRVWAEVENDKSTEVVEMTLNTSSTVSYDSIQNQKYLVGSDGTLTINDGSNKNSAVANLIQSLFAKASAENAMDYSYSGSWVVRDTRTVTYHTTFFAEDTQGRIKKLVLAWSDPCSFGGGAVQTYCSLSGEVDGVDNVNMTFAGDYNITLSGGATLVFNPGKAITGLTGSRYITIQQGTNTQIQKALLYYTDADGDGYAPNATKNISGGLRVYQASGTNDCYDSGASASSVHPGQTNYFTAGYGPSLNNWDYNCDSSQSPSITSGYAFGQNEGGTVVNQSLLSRQPAAGGSCQALTAGAYGYGHAGQTMLASNILPKCGAQGPVDSAPCGGQTWSSVSCGAPSYTVLDPVYKYFTTSNCTGGSIYQALISDAGQSTQACR